MIPRAVRAAAIILALLTTIGASGASAQEADPADVIFGILLISIPVGIRVVFCGWIFSDAGKRGISSAGWILLTIFFPLIGLILYIVERDKQRPAYYYYQNPYPYQYYPYGQPHGNPSGPGDAYGGFRPSVSCRNCRAQIALGSVYCPTCGHPQR